MPDKSDSDIYREFIDWLGKAWWGLPDSEHLIRTIRSFYNPEEAALLTGIPFSGRNLEELAEIKDMVPEELASRLDALARRGAIWRSQKGESIRYSLNDSFFVFMRGPYWAEQPDDATKSTSGLVHAISNWQEGADTICNCCTCCCLFFEAYHVLKHHKNHDISNYRVRTTPETCKACGLCVERCPMEALRLEDSPEATNKKGKVAVLDPDKCIGCGVCVYKCATQALILERKEETYHPPKDVREWMERWYADKKVTAAKNRIGGKEPM